MARRRDESIERYREKRDFARTPEPRPAELPARRGPPVFVVHRHDARRLHYDLRIEMEGVLRSWAVPKGFSYDPQTKHLAVRTEDHPLEYEDFHGVIPRGQYGAGTMRIWDRGHYEVLHAPDAPAAVAAGELKLLLFGRKLRGEWHLVRTGQGEGQWLLFKSRDRYAGPGRDSALGVDLAAAPQRPMPRSLAPPRASGEAAPFSDPDWLFELELAGRRVLAEKRGDAVRLRGLRRRLPEVEAGLSRLRAESALLDGVLVAHDEHERPSRELLEQRLARAPVEGVRLYLFDLLYFDEFDLRGLPLVDRKGALRNVLPEDPAVLFVDHVPGEGESLVAAVAAAGLEAVIAKRAGSAYGAGPLADWRRIPVGAAPRATELPVADALARHAGPAAAARGGGRVKLTNLAKVYWPAEGFTKGDLVAYYERVADLILPYLVERPMHLNRFPDGIDGKSFYQKDAKEETPDWVTTERIASEKRGEEIRYVVCDSRETLLYLANLGSIDLHPWLSRRATPDSPDWAVIDLDPKEAPFLHVVRIARSVGRVLHAIGLRPLLKTSGKTGLHVYVPLEPGYTYEQSRTFCEGVARVVTREHPDIATVERVIGSREGKVYVDFGQNRRGQTVVPPYCVRPVRGATVSAPLLWEELTDDLSPARFTIQTIFRRLEEHGDLFSPALGDLQSLLPAIEGLAEYVRGRERA